MRTRTAQESKIDSRSMPGEEQLDGSGWCEGATAGTNPRDLDVSCLVQHRTCSSPHDPWTGPGLGPVRCSLAWFTGTIERQRRASTRVPPSLPASRSSSRSSSRSHSVAPANVGVSGLSVNEWHVPRDYKCRKMRHHISTDLQPEI